MRKTDWDREFCAGCREQIKFGEKTGLNGAWHARCWKASERGAATAKRRINTLLRSLDYPCVDELQAMVGYSTASISEAEGSDWTRSVPIIHDGMQVSHWDGLKHVPAFVREAVKRPHAIQIA